MSKAIERYTEEAVKDIGRSKAQVLRTMLMHKVIVFALFSTRRQAEITRLTWDDFQRKHKRILVRYMKHPGEKLGNDTGVDLPEEAIRVIDSMRQSKAEIFPYSPDAITADFTRACKLVGIEDLHFHDLRHEGISRLFEMGSNIPHDAAVSVRRHPRRR